MGRTTKKPASVRKNATSATVRPLVEKHPQSKQKAAVQAGMFLHTNDAWSKAYFDENDLHCIERELFG